MRRAAFSQAALVLALFPLRSSAQAPGIPALLQRAIAVYQAEVHGIIGMQRHFSTVIDAGIAKHGEESESGFLMNDGAFVKIKYYKVEDDGKAFSAEKIVVRENETNRSWSEGKVFFKEPYDRRYVGDYRFSEPQACSGCPEGTVELSFTSAIRDEQHGNGDMWLETATARVVRLTYTPNALPPHATSGTVTETSGRALADLWYVTRIEETYRGHELILSGTGTFTGTFDRFRRFPSLAEAETALQEGTI